MRRMTSLMPTVSFIIPVRGEHEFLIKQINAIFKFSENYGGLCEVLLLAGGGGDLRLKLAWLAMKINGAGHPFVRTKMIRYAAELDLADLIDAGLHNALGEKIVVFSDYRDLAGTEKTKDPLNRNVQFAESLSAFSLSFFG
jgi:hypothetical protein